MCPVSLDAEEVSNEPNELAAGDSEEEHRKARERKRRAESDDPRESVGSCVSSACGA